MYRGDKAVSVHSVTAANAAVVAGLGGFHCVFEPCDRTQPLSCEDKSTEVWSSITVASGLVDTGLPETGTCLSAHFQGLCHVRLDRAYISSALFSDRPVCEVKPIAFLDDCLVVSLGRRGSSTSRLRPVLL